MIRNFHLADLFTIDMSLADILDGAIRRLDSRRGRVTSSKSSRMQPTTSEDETP
jgi:hypothetical protein